MQQNEEERLRELNEEKMKEKITELITETIKEIIEEVIDEVTLSLESILQLSQKQYTEIKELQRRVDLLEQDSEDVCESSSLEEEEDEEEDEEEEELKVEDCEEQYIDPCNPDLEIKKIYETDK